MAKLSEDLKRMLTGLAYQDAGDFLSISEKMKVLGDKEEKPEFDNAIKPTNVLQKVETGKAEAGKVEARKIEAGKINTRKINSGAAIKRIAFISNGGGLDTPLNYVIDNCLLQNAQIDLLIHGATDMTNISALKKKIQNAGINFKQIQLKANAVDSLINYVAEQPSLIFLVATPDDAVAKVLIDDVLPRRSSCIHAPLVLIKDQVATNTAKQTAA